MHIYVGKLDWYEYATDECITIVFPAGFALKDPACAYWQWSTSFTGVSKENCIQNGSIIGVTSTTKEYGVRFESSYYSFQGYVTADFKSLSLTMTDPDGKHAPVELSLQYSDTMRIPSTSVFTGKLDWLTYSVNEMATLIIPGEVANDQPVILSRQWTVDHNGTPKGNDVLNTVMRAVGVDDKGNVKAEFGDGYYTFNFTILKSDGSMSLGMTKSDGYVDPSAPYRLTQTDFRDLGALIVRYGTGTDDGIFKVQDMLINYLGFSSNDVELLYFDVDPPSGPKECTLGQDPPTIANFKSKFTKLCTNAEVGDVSFLYVDARNTTYPDEDGSDARDDGDDGWILAGNDDGTSKEILPAVWLADTISKNLTKGVNLTIASSSSIGSSELDGRKAVPGILLTGCHETQFNIKALNGKDPWIVAVTSVIKDNARRQRGVPTYSALFNEAKNFIRAHLANKQLAENYKGPSPSEWDPVPGRQADNTSNQDPQLTFYQDFFDPSEERFLLPFQAPINEEADGQAVRFPRDEYPHEEL
ncbi:hypothetical protein F5Y00DRAFT_273118 [Daldinia vernicosa]|uniref:uncharacterized protein n=1 Tax=Daldinia vernicosa TaxID=114800 RepID=UPI002008AB82|nr:uncharacterized protein F5Y00DRAFT_273118 [Daldinia vernicosa]KAI0852512.1 hypothetical protein F5Y00DRAFT_273118 [Daldinia vernicosa]